MIETAQLTAELVKCEICLKEIPKSDAQSAEARDYMAYFCGLECYEEWMKEKTQEAGEP